MSDRMLGVMAGQMYLLTGCALAALLRYVTGPKSALVEDVTDALLWVVLWPVALCVALAGMAHAAADRKRERAK